MLLSPKRNSTSDSWNDPIINLDRFDTIAVSQLDTGAPAIQFLNVGADTIPDRYTSWIYTDQSARDKEFKRIQNLIKWPAWLSSLALTLGY